MLITIDYIHIDDLDFLVCVPSLTLFFIYLVLRSQ